MKNLFILFLCLLITDSSFSNSTKNCEKSLSSFQRIYNQTKNSVRQIIRPVRLIQRRIIRERLITPLGEIKQPYKGIIGQSLYAAVYHKSYIKIPNVDAAYKSVAPHLTQMELNRLRWSPPRKVKP